jgi:hypothetical protein
MRLGLLIAIAAASVLGPGCGTYVPEVELGSDSPHSLDVFVNTIVQSVKCQLRDAVADQANGADLPWLKHWSAEITLTLNVTEKSSLSPGVTANTFFPGIVTKFRNGTSVTSGQSFTFALGGSYTSTAGRIIALTWADDFKDFFGETSECHLKNGIAGDLKLNEVVNAAVAGATFPGEMSRQSTLGGPYQNVQETLSFEIDTNANATPTWRYVNVAASTGGNFFTADRDRKDQLLITMGPSSGANGTKGSTIGSNDVSTIHNLSRIVSPLQ